jgi:hypothetical protein
MRAKWLRQAMKEIGRKLKGRHVSTEEFQKLLKKQIRKDAKKREKERE